MEQNFEYHLNEVEHIVKAMEAGQLSLDDSIKAYEKGMKAIQKCQEYISKAESSFKILEQSLTGSLEEKNLHSYEKPAESDLQESESTRKKPRAPVSRSPKHDNLNLFD